MWFAGILIHFVGLLCGGMMWFVGAKISLIQKKYSGGMSIIVRFIGGVQIVLSILGLLGVVSGRL